MKTVMLTLSGLTPDNAIKVLEFAKGMATGTECETVIEDAPAKKPTKGKTKPEPVEETEEEAESEDEEELDNGGITKEDVLDALDVYSEANSRKDALKVLKSFGVAKLDELPASKYEALMKKLKV